MRRVLSLFSMVAILSTPALAEETLTSRIVANANAPLELERCRPNELFAGTYTVFLNLHNRTAHQLLTLEVQFKVYDSESTLIGQNAFTETPGQPLASDDTQVVQQQSSFQTSEPASAISYMTCKIVGATFTGRRVWHSGQIWPEKLLPKGAEDTSGLSPGALPASTSAQTDDAKPPAKLATNVVNAWNDLDPVSHVGTLVHERIRIDNPRAQSVSAYPGHFALTIALASGTRNTYMGLSRPAPVYPKYDFVNKVTTYVPEVAPDEDLGKLGFVSVPSNGSTTTTVTFFVPEALAASADIRNVVYR